MTKNRRIIIIDDDPGLEIQPLQWSSGLVKEYYTVSGISRMPEGEQEEVLRLGPGDGAILVGPGAFGLIRTRYHAGIRGENYFDCSLLRRLGLDSGAFVKVYHENDQPRPGDFEFFVSPAFGRVREFPGYTWRIVKTAAEAFPFLDYLEGLPVGTEFGFDYETSGMSLDADLIVTGAAVAVGDSVVYFGFTDIREDPEGSRRVSEQFARILRKHADHVWTFNTQYEQQVSWREFGVEAGFPDTGVYNVLDGLHSKNYSLKWTIQRLLGGGDVQTPGISDYSVWDKGGIVPWDTDFDRLSDLLDRMYYLEEPVAKGRKATRKVLKVTESDWENTPEWAEICQRYPGYVEEFRTLIGRYFGRPFLNIPTDILGYYCCLDAFYTLKARTEHSKRYSEICHEVFGYNIKLGALLHRGGMFKDEPFRAAYEEECRWSEAYAITYCATARCYWKMAEHKSKAGDPKRYNKDWLTLMDRDKFYGGRPIDIVKGLLGSYVSEAYDTGFDEGSFMMDYGEDFAVFLRDRLAERMKEVKFKGKIDETIVRKKKIIGLLATDLVEYLGLPETLGPKHAELEKYLWYKKAYTEFLRIWDSGLTLDNVPTEFEFMGTRMRREEYTKYVMETYFKCSSPIEALELTKELLGMYPTESVFLTTVYAGINKLPDGKRFFKNRGITDPRSAYNLFMAEWKVWWENTGKSGITSWPAGYQCVFPAEIWPDAYRYWNTIGPGKTPDDDLKTTWESFDGYLKQLTYFEFGEDWKHIGAPYSEADWQTDTFDQARKLVGMVMMYKKYRKLRTAYVASGSSGMPDDKPAMFCATDRQVIIDPATMMPLREAFPGEPGAVTKMFPHYEVMKKETKRWSSGYHTIISHSDVKDVIAAPPGYLLAYFDISSAEVRAAAYRAKDPVMIHLFETGQDLYIHAAKLHFREQWEHMDGPEKAKWRKSFKTILLGVMYGMGVPSLAKRLGVDLALAQLLVDTMMGEFKVLKDFIDRSMAWPGQHNGYINQVYGDTLRSRSWRYRTRSDGSIDTYKDFEVQRHGINWLIQSASALTLAAGFYNNIIQGRLGGTWLVPIIVVHDSNTNYFPIDRLFDLRSQYDTNFTGYCSDPRRVDSPFLFDLLIGPAYQSAAEVKHLAPDLIEMKASAHVINGVLRKIDTESSLIVETDIPRDQIVSHYVTDRTERFLKEGGCSMVMDTSEYKVQFRKIGNRA